MFVTSIHPVRGATLRFGFDARHLRRYTPPGFDTATSILRSTYGICARGRHIGHPGRNH